MTSSTSSNSLRELYISNFSPEEYCDTFFRIPKEQLLDMLKLTFDFFSIIAKEKKGAKVKVLDFGCGPNPLYMGLAIAAGLNMEVTMSEFLPQNREALSRWIKKEEGAYNHNLFFDSFEKFCDKRGCNIQEELRKSIVKIESYDLHDDLSHANSKYDIIHSSFCLDAAAGTVEQHSEFLKKLALMIPIGGKILLGTLLNESFYKFGNTTYEHARIDEENLKQGLDAAGLKILCSKKIDNTFFIEKTHTDYEEASFCIAERIF